MIFTAQLLGDPLGLLAPSALQWLQSISSVNDSNGDERCHASWCWRNVRCDTQVSTAGGGGQGFSTKEGLAQKRADAKLLAL